MPIDVSHSQLEEVDIGGSSSEEITPAQPSRIEVSKPEESAEEEAAAGPSTPSLYGFHAAVDAARCAAGAIRWAHLDTGLLAYGGQDGVVRVVGLDGGGATLLHALPGHTRRVMDIDWSFDNSFLISCSDDGTLSLWDTQSWVLARTFNTFDGPVTCCRFHPSNPNLVFVGTGLGTVLVLNSSTGLRIASALLRSAPKAGVGTAYMECLGEAKLLVADSRGACHSYRFVAGKPGGAPKLQLLGYSAVPMASKGALGEPAGLQYVPRAAATGGGPTVVMASANSETLVLEYQEKGCRLQLRLQISFPPASHKLRPAMWTPPGAGGPSLSRRELLAMGGEDCRVHLWTLPGQSEGGPEEDVRISGKLAGHGAPPTEVAWSWDGEYLASCDARGLLILWRRGADEAVSAAHRV